MENRYKTLLQEVPKDLPANGLSHRIILRIETLELRRNRLRLFTWGTITVGAVVSLIPVLMSTVSSFTASGFGSYFSLIFSDSGVVFSNWQAFGTSLFETFPAAEVALLLGICTLFLWAGRSLAQIFLEKTQSSPLQAVA